MADVRLASTVMLLRDGSSGLEVFMVQRHRRSGFLPRAWVFPGGRVDARDHLDGNRHVQGGDQLASAFGVERGLGVAHAVAGIRETFEEAGVWLGSGILPDTLREPLNNGDVAFDAVLEAHGAQVDLDQLVPWSWWVTPEIEPKRYDTRFVAVHLQGPVEASHDDKEVVDSRWVSPRAVLAAEDQEAFPLAPPQWWTFRELARFGTVAEALASDRPTATPIQPVMNMSDAGLWLLLPGHPEHPAPAIDGVADRITFESSWVAWRGDERLPPVPA